MTFKKLLKNKLFIFILGAVVVTLSQGGFKLSLLVISFVVFYVLLWGYDNPWEKELLQKKAHTVYGLLAIKIELLLF